MILERALVHVLPGQEAEFERSLGEARQVIAKADGFRSIQVLRGVESPHTYLLLIEWDSLDAHMQGFRESELYNHWRALLYQHFDGATQVEHYAPIDEA